jgi:hypothetical protein
MPVKPTTAHACAPIDDAASQEAEFITRYAQSSPEQQFKIIRILEASEWGDVPLLQSVIDDPTTPEKAKGLLVTALSKLQAELDTANFQPVFARKQISELEANQQAHRDRYRKVALFVLCMTEKRLHQYAKDNATAFSKNLEQVGLFVDDSKSQLELAEKAKSRMMMVNEYAGGAA